MTYTQNQYDELKSAAVAAHEALSACQRILNGDIRFTANDIGSGFYSRTTETSKMIARAKRKLDLMGAHP